MAACRDGPTYKAPRQASSRLAMHRALIRGAIYLDGLAIRLTWLVLFTTVWGGRHGKLPFNRGSPSRAAVLPSRKKRATDNVSPKRSRSCSGSDNVGFTLSLPRCLCIPALGSGPQTPTAMSDGRDCAHHVKISKKTEM
jgi:hypothetical protein